jgi:hypothetical protein
MFPDYLEAIRREYNATVEAISRARVRALHLVELLLQVRQELGPVVGV